VNVRLRALERAQRYIGVGEDPPGSNDGLKVRAWLHEAGAPAPNPWCAAFDYSMKTAEGSQSVRKIQYPASVLSWVEAADAHGWRMPRPYRGDDVAYSWHGHDPHPNDHIGIVEKVLALPRPRLNGLSWKYWIRTVEGNTGDAVRRRWRWVDPHDVAFIRIPD
jgi:hypothetical protein